MRYPNQATITVNLHETISGFLLYFRLSAFRLVFSETLNTGPLLESRLKGRGLKVNYLWIIIHYS